jgi:acyl carrier protein
VDRVIPTLLAEIVAEHLDVAPDTLDPGLHLADDLGVDSIALLDLGMRLEDVFDVWLSDEQLGSLVTIADLTEAVREAVACRDA